MFSSSGEALMKIILSARVSRFLALVILAAFAFAFPAQIAFAQDSSPAGVQEGQHWVASWATSPAAYFVYRPPVTPAAPGFPATYAPAVIQPDLAFPFPEANKNQALNQTFRSIVKPDLWGNQMRFRFSNVFGSQPLTVAAVSVGLQEYSGNVVKGTLVKVTFNGKPSIVIPVGQEIWSDA